MEVIVESDVVPPIIREHLASVDWNSNLPLVHLQIDRPNWLTRSMTLDIYRRQSVNSFAGTVAQMIIVKLG